MEALTYLGCVVVTLLVHTLSCLPEQACCGNPKGHVTERHHGYLVVFVGVPITWVQIVALVIGCDDLIQHLVQLFGPDKYWKGPIHRAWAALR